MNRSGRLHAPSLDALADPPFSLGDRPVVYLRAPRPGVFVPAVDHGDLVSPGSTLGQLVVLGRSFALIASRVSGFAVQLDDPDAPQLGRRAVAYGDILFALDLSSARVPAGELPGDAVAAASAEGLVFRAPTSGRFYGRSSPDKPAFVAEGSELVAGATVCLLEVMKTFHRVVYGGAGLPETARVVRVLVRDGDDVNAGDPLLALA